MKMSEFRALERNIKIVQAHDRLTSDEIKGLTIQVIFEQTRGNNDAPVQLFIAEEDASFAAIMAVVNDKMSSVKTEADTAIAAAKSKLAAE